MFIVKEQPKSIVTENYKILRTNIEYSSFDGGLKTILVTSSEPGEGKTTTAGNLAICLAQDNKRIVLIDCDLRRPMLHRRFKVSNDEGLSEIIIGKVSLEDSIKEVYTGLDIITAGKIPPNPSEMLGSNDMKELIDKLKEIYDYIILDSPPVLAVTDAQILSRKVDGTILVIKSTKTKKANVINAKELLDKVRGNIIGVVLNEVKIKNDKCYYYGKVTKNKKRSKRKKKTINEALT